MVENIYNFIETIKKIAQKNQCTLDFLIVDKNLISFMFNGKNVDKIEISNSLNIGIKVIKNNKHFIVNLLSFDENEIKNKIDLALIAMEILPKNDLSHFDSTLDGYKTNYEKKDCNVLYEKFSNNKNNLNKIEKIKNKINEFDENLLDDFTIVNCENLLTSEDVYYFFGNSLGFNYSYLVSSAYLASKIVIKDMLNKEMEIGYEFDIKSDINDLKSINLLTEKAKEKATKALNPQKSLAGKFDVLISKNIFKELIGYFLELVNGENIRQNNSFLKDCLDKKIFKSGVNICDIPKYKNGYYDVDYDMQGGKCEDLFLIENGFLKNFTLDVETSLKMKMKNNYRGFRTISSDYKPANTNILVENKLRKEKHDLDEVLTNIKSGYYINKTMGMGVNLVNGDYSKGASGFYVEDGKILYPVNNITLAGNLKEIFYDLEIFNDVNDKKLSIFCGYAIMKNIVVATK